MSKDDLAIALGQRDVTVLELNAALRDEKAKLAEAEKRLETQG
jgi:hypothetical protein